MKLQVSESVNKKDWDTKICFAGGTIFHSSIWADYTMAGNPNAVPQYYTLLSDDGEFLGAALGFQDCSPHKLLKRFTRSLWFDAMPVVRNNDGKLFYEFIGLLDSQARRTGYVHLLIESYASRDASSDLEKLGYDLMRRLEFELLLDCSEKDLWSGLESKQRNIIRKAERIGVKLHNLPAQKGVQELRRLQIESGQRILQRGGPDVIYRGEHLHDPVGVLVESGLGTIVAAEVNGAFVSAALFTFFNGLVYFTMAGHDEVALKTQAPTFLLWETIKRFRNDGATRFNLGGCKATAMNKDSAEHGVYAYKKTFGAKCVECATGVKILKKTSHGLISAIKVIVRR
jgi:hypothetical protein